MRARRQSEGAVDAVDAKGFAVDTSLNAEKDPTESQTDEAHALDDVSKSLARPAVANMPHKPVAAPDTVHTTGR